MPKTAELHYDGKVIQLPIIEGSEGERAIDIEATSPIRTGVPLLPATGTARRSSSDAMRFCGIST